MRTNPSDKETEAITGVCEGCGDSGQLCHFCKNPKIIEEEQREFEMGGLVP